MGREFFSKYWFFLNIIIKLFRVFPVFICDILWSFSLNKSGAIFIAFRYFIFSCRVGGYNKNTYLGSSLVLKNIENMSVGENVSLHDFCYVDAIGGIEIGDNVSIAHGTSLVSFDHTWGDVDVPIKYNPVVLGRIVIEDDVWVGCGVRIMAGVRIGSRSIVAAGAVVVKDVPEGVLVGGVPAKVIKRL